MSLVDMRIDVDDYFPKVSVGYRRSSSLPLMIIDDHPRSSISNFSYWKLPEKPLRLSVLKLDGSCFEIEVTKSATIAELREAVEAAFSHMPKQGPGKISWPHVWGHFCLCFDDQKLLAETDYIRRYGIRDGDQLQFIRHISNNYRLTKKQSLKWGASLEQYKISLSPSNSHREKEQNHEEGDCHEDVENGRYQHSDEKDDDIVEHEASWAHLFKWWSPYSRLPTMERMRGLKASPSRSACGFLGGFRRIFSFCGNSSYSRRDTWRED